ncbi:hypothetical protein [uncultured Gammaproteobacteria bacterium]|nr:hypothetical protein [uncultured Gammaproteobacteria bacterium]
MQRSHSISTLFVLVHLCTFSLELKKINDTYGILLFLGVKVALRV